MRSKINQQIGNLRKIFKAAAEGYIEVSELQKIQAPTLVISADRKDVYIEESVKIYRAILQAQLCILPGADHFTFQHKADWLNPILLAFLAAP